MQVIHGLQDLGYDPADPRSPEEQAQAESDMAAWQQAESKAEIDAAAAKVVKAKRTMGWGQKKAEAELLAATKKSRAAEKRAVEATAQQSLLKKGKKKSKSKSPVVVEQPVAVGPVILSLPVTVEPKILGMRPKTAMWIGIGGVGVLGLGMFLFLRKG